MPFRFPALAKGESTTVVRQGCCNCRDLYACCYCGKPPESIKRYAGGTSWKPNPDCPGRRATYRIERID